MNTVVKTRYGEVRGSVADGVNTFKGIPYAAPPFGANRLRPPQPVAPWSGVRDALSYGPKTPQPSYPPEVSVLLPELAIPGEDCLTLNIWSPDLGSARQPVMVWIPGSAFQYGTAAMPWYDGSRFARDGIVCVTINYRVGVDGFLYLGEGNANRALLDQVAALQWVQENIAAFGGDPQNVTIFGESAGAMSVGTLLSMPRAEGLFHRAIAQSGAAHPVISAATAQRVGRYLAEKLGVEATREAIAAVPLDRMLAAQAELEADLFAHPDPERWGAEVVASMVLWQPVVDGDVIPARPIDRIVAGAGADIDVMVGTNTDDWRLFLVARWRDRPRHRRGPGRSCGGLRTPGRSDIGRLSRRTSGSQRRRPARGYPDRLVVSYPRHPPGRCTCEEPLGHLHVRVRLALAAVQRTPWRVPCA